MADEESEPWRQYQDTSTAVADATDGPWTQFKSSEPESDQPWLQYQSSQPEQPTQQVNSLAPTFDMSWTGQQTQSQKPDTSGVPKLVNIEDTMLRDSSGQSPQNILPSAPQTDPQKQVEINIQNLRPDQVNAANLQGWDALKQLPQDVWTGVGQGSDVLANVAKASVADVADTLSRNFQNVFKSRPEIGGEGNLFAYFDRKPMPIDEAISMAAKDAVDRGEFPSEAAVAQLSQDLTATAPMIIGFGMAPKAVQALIGAGFTYKMLTEAPETFRRLGTEMGKPIEQRDPHLIAQLVSQGAQEIGFGGLGLLHGISTGKNLVTDFANKDVTTDAPPTATRFQHAQEATPSVEIKRLTELAPADFVKEAKSIHKDTDVSVTQQSYALARKMTTEQLPELQKGEDAAIVALKTARDARIAGMKEAKESGIPADMDKLMGPELDAQSKKQFFTEAIKYRKALDDANGVTDPAKLKEIQLKHGVGDLAPEKVSVESAPLSDFEKAQLGRQGTAPAEVTTTQNADGSTRMSITGRGAVDNPVSVEDASKAVSDMLGDRTRGNIKLINDPNNGNAGWVDYQAGKRPQITVNLAHHGNVEWLKATVRHELIHPVIERPGFEKYRGFLESLVSDKLKGAEAFKGYPTDAAKLNEASLYIVEKLFQEHLRDSRFQRGLNQVRLAVKRLFGVDLTAREVALHLVNEALKNKAVPKGARVGEIQPLGETAGVAAKRAFAQEPIKPEETIPEDSGKDKYGIAERVREERAAAGQVAPVEPGEGISAPDSVEHGRELLRSGGDAETALSNFEKTGKLSADDMALTRAQGETLAKSARDTERQLGKDSPQYKAAFKALSDWDTRTKAMQTEWHKTGMAQQGETDIDTGTFTGLARAFKAATGKDFTPGQAETAKRTAKRVTDSEKVSEKANQELNQELDKLSVPKPETPDTAGLTPEKKVWQKVREYLDQGMTSFDEMRNKAATDLGMSVKDVTNLLTKTKKAKRLADEAWRKQQAMRRFKEQAKRWLTNTQIPAYQRAIASIPRSLFALKVGFHGTVALGTHAPMVAFQPRFWANYVRDFGKMYKMVGSPAYYERQVQDLLRRPNYTTGRRAGLINDPFQYEDFNNPQVSQYFGRLSGMGNRGYAILKILRQDMFDQHWNQLPKTAQIPEVAQAIADAVNHATGVVKGKAPAGSNVALFAPRLLASRVMWLAADPAKAVDTFARWKTSSEADKIFAINQVKEKAWVAGTMMGLLALNQGMLSATDSKQKINFTDPFHSDWLKFKAGGMTASYGNAMITMARLPVRLYKIRSSDGGKLKNLVYPDEDTYTVLGEYARSQASPFASLVSTLWLKGDWQNRPLPNSDRPVPKRLRAQGVKPYTWTEFVAEQVAPIPVEEALREVWGHGLGMNADQMKATREAMATIAVMSATGGRLTEDVPYRAPSSSGGGVKYEKSMP